MRDLCRWDRCSSPSATTLYTEHKHNHNRGSTLETAAETKMWFNKRASCWGLLAGDYFSALKDLLTESVTNTCCLLIKNWFWLCIGFLIILSVALRKRIKQEFILKKWDLYDNSQLATPQTKCGAASRTKTKRVHEAISRCSAVSLTLSWKLCLHSSTQMSSGLMSSWQMMQGSSTFSCNQDKDKESGTNWSLRTSSVTLVFSVTLAVNSSIRCVFVSALLQSSVLSE